MATLADDILTRASESPALITETEYFAMCEAGVFGDDHVELNRGVLERTAPSGQDHGKTFARAVIRIASAYEGTGWDAMLEHSSGSHPASSALRIL